MGNIKLDKNYNLIEEKGIYSDNLIEAVDLISRAQFDKIITDEQASFLLKMVINKEFKKETKSIVPLTRQVPEILSLFMNMKSKKIQHA